MNYNEDEIVGLIELRGVYDGYSIVVLGDGTRFNRWGDGEGNPLPGHEYRWEVTEAFLNGEESNGRWF